MVKCKKRARKSVLHKTTCIRDLLYIYFDLGYFKKTHNQFSNP